MVTQMIKKTNGTVVELKCTDLQQTKEGLQICGSEMIYYGAIALKRITRPIPDVFIKRESVCFTSTVIEHKLLRSGVII